MKNLTIIGILLLGISGLLFYMTTNLEVEEFTLSHFMGIMGGVGIGLISHSLTSRHFQFFVKNIPIKEQADKV